MAADKAYILALPMELLQQVSRFLNRTDLITLRLACKELSSAAFDAFAEEYLDELTCFFPNPARLSRLWNICSSSHLVSKVRQVTLTLDPWEGQPYGKIHIAAISLREEPKSFSRAQYGIFQAHRNEHVKLYHAQQPDLALLASLLRNLDPALCKLHVVLQNFLEHGQPCYHYADRDALRVMSEAGFPLSDIDFTNFDGLELQESRAQDAVFQTMESLRKIIYHTTDAYYAKTRKFADTDATPRLIAAAERLEDLHLVLLSQFHHRDNDASFGFGAQLLLANKLSHLRTLGLTCVRLPDFQTLFEALRPCNETLECVYFDEITVHSTSHQWAEVLGYPRTIPYLRGLTMEFLYHGGDVRDFTVCVRDAEDSTLSLELFVAQIGKENIDATLARLIERGIVLESR
ncbi:hypothetical protein LTR37_017272 [Vermiconidia calcicola]|uniref:Uncharacterized protein n=1 Tax=Vermiconidia calcicola TaxID=1690605 RepID=A0ACC3MKJ8_9PEZI|nr:hypothetical protein LTR37_017272 [Vermiconidia calcicola]